MSLRVVRRFPATLPVTQLVTVSSAPAPLAEGETYQWLVTALSRATPTGDSVELSGRTITYASSNEAVATITSGGLVEWVAEGMATMTATCEGVSITLAVETYDASPSPAATALDVITQPGGAVDDVAFTTQPSVRVLDQYGNPIATSGVTVTAAIVSGTGTLSGTVTAVTNGSGVATFSNLKVVGTGAHTLGFTAPALTGATSSEFTVFAAGAFARKPSYPTPSLPTPLRTFYVDASAGSDSNSGTEGSPFQTIGKIHSTMQPGDRFYLKGTFGGTTGFGSAGTGGTSTDPIQIVAWPGQSATLNNGGGVNEYPPIHLTSNARNHFWFSGITVLPPSGAIQRVMSYYGGTNCVFIGCTFTNCALFLYGAPDFTFYDCTWDGSLGNESSNSGDALIGFQGSHRVGFYRCTFDVECYHGIGGPGWLQAGITQTCDDWHFFDCYFRNIRAGGIWSYGWADRMIVEWCTFEDMALNKSTSYYVGSVDALYIQGPNTIARYNTIKNCRGGIWLLGYWFGGKFQSFNGAHVHNNVVYNCTHRHALHMFMGPEDPPTYPIVPDVDGTGVVIENNICWNGGHNPPQTEENGYYAGGGTHYPLWLSAGMVAGSWTIGDDLGGNIIRNNLISRDADDTRFAFFNRHPSAGGNITNWTLAAFHAALPDCSGNQQADPLFVDPDNGDFRLQAGSPCINAGYATSGVAYLGASPDMGVFEYGGID